MERRAFSPIPESQLQPVEPPTSITEFHPNIPMYEIPFERHVSERDRFVARHEFGHALAAYNEGFAVSLVSIIPKPGEYEGVTILKGSVHNLHAFQVVSAAGAAAVNSMEGAGSDMGKIHAIHESYGGYTVNEALSRAKAIINSLSKEEWRIIEEIIAFKKEITGTDIPHLLARARYEAQTVQNNVMEQFTHHIEIINDEVLDNPEVPEIIITTITEDLGNGMVRTYNTVNGQKDFATEKVICNKCRQLNTHATTCENATLMST